MSQQCHVNEGWFMVSILAGSCFDHSGSLLHTNFIPPTVPWSTTVSRSILFLSLFVPSSKEICAGFVPSIQSYCKNSYLETLEIRETTSFLK